jgi:hypothetical protein
MIQGTCKECGKNWYGWSLESGDNKCECGGEIITEKQQSDDYTKRLMERLKMEQEYRNPEKYEENGEDIF